MAISPEVKNPPTKPALKAHITAKNRVDAKAAASKVGASNKPPFAPKVGDQDKMKMTPLVVTKRELESLPMMLQRRKILVPFLP